MLDALYAMAVGGAVGLTIAKLWDLFVAPYMPERWHRFWSWLSHAYMDLWRPFIPDSVYKLWLRTGIMSEGDYRAFQEKGHIKDDLDPNLIQKHD